MSLKKRLTIVTALAGFLLSALLYLSHNLTFFPFIHRFSDWLFSDHYTSVMFFSFVAVAILGAAIYMFVDRYINRRIQEIHRDMQHIRGMKDLSVRLTEDDKGDEISRLIKNINDTLDGLESERNSREKVEEMLITNEKLVSIGRLTASIAHEINNPVLAISNCIRALRNTCKGTNNAHKEALEVSEKEITRVRNMIASLLDYHRLDQVEFTDVSLKEVLKQSVDVLKWGKKLIDIQVCTDVDRKCIIYGSHTKLKQVFVNFISNAVEAVNGRKGILRIEMEPTDNGEYCRLHFIDNGPGISPTVRHRLFEPFVSTKQGKGVGLGLYVSYEIIKNHGGEIHYNSDYKNGAHFIIKLPMKKRQP